MIDVRSVVELAHARGALVLLDSYQAIGSLPVDVQELGVDLLGAGVLKYLLGSAGLGFFYCRRELVERVWPTQTGWFADENIFAMDHTDYSPAPHGCALPVGHAAGACDLRGHSGDPADAGDRRCGDARARARVELALLDGLDELGRSRDTAAPEARGALSA